MDVTFYVDKPFSPKLKFRGRQDITNFSSGNLGTLALEEEEHHKAMCDEEPGLKIHCPAELEATTACLVNETAEPETTIAEIAKPETTTTYPTNKKSTAQADKPLLVYSKR